MAQQQNNLVGHVRALAALVGVFAAIIGALLLWEKIFVKKPTGPLVEVIYVYTTMNGHLYEKEATAQDLSSGSVNFGDGVVIPWSEVKSKRLKYHLDELSFPRPAPVTNSPVR